MPTIVSLMGGSGGALTDEESYVYKRLCTFLEPTKCYWEDLGTGNKTLTEDIIIWRSSFMKLGAARLHYAGHGAGVTSRFGYLVESGNTIYGMLATSAYLYSKVSEIVDHSDPRAKYYERLKAIIETPWDDLVRTELDCPSVGSYNVNFDVGQYGGIIVRTILTGSAWTDMQDSTYTYNRCACFGHESMLNLSMDYGDQNYNIEMLAPIPAGTYRLIGTTEYEVKPANECNVQVWHKDLLEVW